MGTRNRWSFRSGLSAARIASIGLCPGLAPGATIFDAYDSDLHDRFDSETFIGQAFDWSGVGRSNEIGKLPRWGTLVSSTFFLSANHFHPSIGATITFHEDNDSAGTTHQATVSSGQRIGSTDLWLGKLDREMPPTLATYSGAATTIPDLAAGLGPFENSPVFTVGVRGSDITTRTTNFVVGENRYDATDKHSSGLGVFDAVGFIQDIEGDANFIAEHETFLQIGDSGAPTFLVPESGTELILLGLHSFIGIDVSTDDFPPAEDAQFDYKTAEASIAGAGVRNMSFDNFVPNSWEAIRLLAFGPEPGDMNGDGAVNGLDIEPFVLALVDPELYREQTGFDPGSVGDINEDGNLDGLDIEPFVAMLAGMPQSNEGPEGSGETSLERVRSAGQAHAAAALGRAEQISEAGIPDRIASFRITSIRSIGGGKIAIEWSAAPPERPWEVEWSASARPGTWVSIVSVPPHDGIPGSGRWSGRAPAGESAGYYRVSAAAPR